MTIQELFIASNDMLKGVITQIADDQWQLSLPATAMSKPLLLQAAVQHHTYDDAWVPDVLAGKTAADVGDQYEALLAATASDTVPNYLRHNERASEAVRGFTDLTRTTHLSYGDFPARDYLQHIITFRTFRAYDFAKVIGVTLTMPDDFVQAMLDEYTPVIEGYRQMGVFPPAIDVSDDATPQAKLMAMVGRD